jgi:hypothetical protein
MYPDIVTQMAVLFTDSLSTAGLKGFLITEYKLFRVMMMSMLWAISSVVSGTIDYNNIGHSSCSFPLKIPTALYDICVFLKAFQTSASSRTLN